MSSPKRGDLGSNAGGPNVDDVGITSILRQSRELLTRHREEEEEEVQIVFTPRARRRNRSQVAANENNTERDQENKTIWFSLVASDQQKSKPPLEQIPSKYLRVKNGSMTVSYIKKYLVQKLNLRSEDEVEISLEGRRLLPSLQLCKLVDLWLQTKPRAERQSVVLGSSAEDFVMTLSYGRRAVFSA